MLVSKSCENTILFSSRLYLPWPCDSGTVAIVTSDGRMIVVSSHVHVNTSKYCKHSISGGGGSDSDFRYIIGGKKHYLSFLKCTCWLSSCTTVNGPKGHNCVFRALWKALIRPLTWFWMRVMRGCSAPVRGWSRWFWDFTSSEETTCEWPLTFHHQKVLELCLTVDCDDLYLGCFLRNSFLSTDWWNDWSSGQWSGKSMRKQTPPWIWETSEPNRSTLLSTDPILRVCPWQHGSCCVFKNLRTIFLLVILFYI